MKRSFGIISLVLGIATVAQVHGATIASWTFETSIPVGTNAGSFGAFAAEVGSGTASASHASSTVYSSPVGNGSAHSFSANTWAVNDFYQFQINAASFPGATGFSGITLSFDQTSSATGPKNFDLTYSTDGLSFTPFASYSPITNAAPNAWSSGTPVPAANITQDLSLVGALNGASTIFFRVVDTSTIAENGGAVALAGTDRIDNFTISGVIVPEPSTMALLALGGVAGLCFFARRKK